MTTFTISLPDDRAAKLAELAKEKGIAPEELVRDYVETLLSEPDGETQTQTEPTPDFAQAAAYVLKKNADLYRRLS